MAIRSLRFAGMMIGAGVLIGGIASAAAGATISSAGSAENLVGEMLKGRKSFSGKKKG